MSIFSDDDDIDYLSQEPLKEKELLGYVVLKDDKIYCASCRKVLLQILKVKETERKNYLIVHCPFCGDKSFKYEISGIIYVAPPNNLVILDSIVDNPTNQVFVSQYKMKKV